MLPYFFKTEAGIGYCLATVTVPPAFMLQLEVSLCQVISLGRLDIFAFLYQLSTTI